jgi:phosphoribosylformimino-5-aminoimidazole carboxamide ribotide isomerase
MQILPVLDVMAGQVVRGIGGRREEYSPIVSRLTQSSDPLAVARAFRTEFEFHEIYLADLDAIRGRKPALAVYRSLHLDGFRLWVDAGIRRVEDVRVLCDAEVATVVAGLETVKGPQVVERLCAEVGGGRIVFSLDLVAGIALGRTAAWPDSDPLEIARAAVAMGITRLLVLDLARVGEDRGTGTEELCVRLAQAHPGIRIAAGGGIRGMDDVQKLAAAGVDTVLIASALHDGRITRDTSSVS